MQYFLKLNVVSILCAVLFVVPLELLANVYRISRLTNLKIGTVNILTGGILIVDLIAGTLLLFFITKKWLDKRKANFWTVILWVPYFVLFVYGLANSFPITYEGDAPNPVTGLLAIAGLLVYPFYILVLNIIGRTSN